LVSIGLGLGSIFAAQWRYNLSKKKYGIVKINQCPVLVKPQPDAEVLMYLVPAQAMEIIEWQDGWARVKNPDDVEGFVNQDQLIRSEALGF
jgi:SH3-like domain-containing protein